MTNLTPNNIRDKVLREMGITEYKEEKKQRKLKPRPVAAYIPRTPMMKYVELVQGKRLEDILMSGSLSVVSKRLDVDPSTVSKWIKRLKLRYTQDNLPTCTTCPQRGPACDGGVCYILMDLEQYDLLEVKKSEMLEWA